MSDRNQSSGRRDRQYDALRSSSGQDQYSRSRQDSPSQRPMQHSDSGFSDYNDRSRYKGQSSNNSSGWERRRHEREDEGHFYTEQDEEAAYRETFEEIQKVKGESVSSTRNALRRIRETEEVASSSLRKLNEQSSQLGKAEEKVIQAEYHATSADVKTQNLEKLNRNFIISTVTGVFSNPFNKSKRREKELSKQVEAQRQLADDKEGARREAQQTQKQNMNVLSGKSNSKEQRQTDAPIRSRQNYLQEEENCAVENEIDSNLTEISGGISRLRMMGLAMTETIDTQNKVLDRMSNKTDDVHDRVRRTGAKLDRIGKS